MRSPEGSRARDLSDVAGAVLAGIAGAITGTMTMLAVVHLPIIVFQLHGDGAGGLLLALGFWGLPAGFIAGIFAGVYAWRRFGGITVAIAMVVSVVCAPIVATVAETVAVGPTPVSPDGCENVNPQFTLASKADVVIFRRVCPGRTPTVQATVLPSGQHYDFVSPGNALVLAAKEHDSLDVFDVRVVHAADSVIAFVYDPRFSVVRLTPRVGSLVIRTTRATSIRPDFGPVAPEISGSDTVPVGQSAPCIVEPRMVDGSPGGPEVSIFKRTCPGKPPTIEAFIAAHGGSSEADHGNALVVDASADSASHPVSIFVIRPSRKAIVFEVDRRAHIIHLAARVNGVTIDAMGGRP